MEKSPELTVPFFALGEVVVLASAEGHLLGQVKDFRVDISLEGEGDTRAFALGQRVTLATADGCLFGQITEYRRINDRREIAVRVLAEGGAQ